MFRCILWGPDGKNYIDKGSIFVYNLIGFLITVIEFIIILSKGFKYMDHDILLVAETGSDIPEALAEELGITLVPMHVNMGSQTLDDGTFPPEDVCVWYDRTGTVPTTSGSTPYDFETVFDRLHRNHPDKKILHLAYSAVTTCSYHSALLAAEGRDYVKSVDTRHVSVGQCAVVAAMAQWLKTHPKVSLEDAAEAAETISRQTRMCFLPRNLDYLRAGGRVSNAVALVGNLLHLHPLIEIMDGRLMAGKKYRGNMEKVLPAVIREFTARETICHDHVWLIQGPRFEDSLVRTVEETLKDLGFHHYTWMPTGCVITCHGGPGAFGIVGTAK